MRTPEEIAMKPIQPIPPGNEPYLAAVTFAQGQFALNYFGSPWSRLSPEQRQAITLAMQNALLEISADIADELPRGHCADCGVFGPVTSAGGRNLYCARCRPLAVVIREACGESKEGM